MRRTLVSIASSTFALVLGSLPLIACGGSTADGGQQGTPNGSDAGTPTSTDDAGSVDPKPVVDAGAPDTATPVDQTYPTAHPPLPVVDYNGGRIIEAVKIVTITFKGDPMESRLQQFGDVITTTPWWTAVSSEYCGKGKCIGKGSNGGHVVLPAPAAATYTDSVDPAGASTIQDLIKAKIADGTFPAPDLNTLYTIYFPTGTTVSLDDGQGNPAQSCANGGFGGYHQSMKVTPAGGTEVPVAYAILPRCDGKEATTTISASHEIIEAATDPEPNVDTAFYMTSSPWGVGGGEVGDVCVDFTGGNTDRVQESGFTVQRSWSNKSAAASHDPCVPIPAGEVYFNAAPKSDVLSIAVGKTQKIDVVAFSDGPMADWSLSVIDFAQFQGGQSGLKLSLDKSTANNGTKATLTVTVNSASQQGGAGFALVSRSGNTTHFWPMVVQ